MNPDENTYKQIEAYLDGSMSKEERLQFEQLIDTNTQLKDTIEVYKNLDIWSDDTNWTITDNTDVLKNTLALFKEDDTQAFSKKIDHAALQFSQTRQNPSKFKFTKLRGIAASIIVMLFLGSLLFFNNKSTHALFDQYYTVNDLPSLTLKSDHTQELAKAEQFFKNNDYKNALTIFLNLKTDTTFSANTSIYLALTYMQLENYNKALSELDQLERSNSIDYHKALWFKALVYLKQDEKEKAKTILKKLTEDPSNFNYAKGKKLLSDL